VPLDDGAGKPLCPTCGGLGYLEAGEAPELSPRARHALELLELSAPAKCAGCGEFLSAVRVQMGLSRCSDCDGKPRRKGRR
jgi:hypothetical protein